MAVEVGLLLLTQASSLGKNSLDRLLRATAPLVGRRLYVAVSDSIIASASQDGALFFDLAACVYAGAHRICRHLDVRFLLDNIKHADSGAKQMQMRCVDRVFLDRAAKEGEHLPTTETKPTVLDAGVDSSSQHVPFSPAFTQMAKTPRPADYGGVVLGGTFDRLHNGHKILLSSAALISRSQFTCGVTEGDMLKNKVLHLLIEPIETRIAAVADFVSDVSSSVRCSVVPITDPFGPSIVDTNLDCIVASQETARGADKVNVRRKENGLNELDIFIVDLVNDPEEDLESADEEKKAGSSKMRKQLLGTLLKAPIKNPNIPSRPYVIGLSGGIACGKTNICKTLARLGADVIDCDRLGHEVYQPGTEAYREIVAFFGDDVVDAAHGHVINRRVLGPKVFSNPSNLAKLNDIVWPRIAQLAQRRIDNTQAKVVVMDAAVLLEAGWEAMVHEVWVPVIPESEAIRRIVARNNLTEQEAKQRIASQMGDRERLKHANVVFCSLWDYAVTEAQVKKAWSSLLQRLH